MSLSEEQKAVLTNWIKEGLSLSDIQKRLESEFEIRLTYMDVRFLVDDLDLELQSEGPQFDEPKVESAPVGGPPGTVSVSLDKVSRPDALVSGQVTFSDGMSAQWHLDQMGRLSLNPKDAEYRPSQEDLQAFQTELSEAVKKAGMY
jgi:hypothetical protein